MWTLWQLAWSRSGTGTAAGAELEENSDSSELLPPASFLAAPSHSDSQPRISLQPPYPTAPPAHVFPAHVPPRHRARRSQLQHPRPPHQTKAASSSSTSSASPDSPSLLEDTAPVHRCLHRLGHNSPSTTCPDHPAKQERQRKSRKSSKRPTCLPAALVQDTVPVHRCRHRFGSATPCHDPAHEPQGIPPESPLARPDEEEDGGDNWGLSPFDRASFDTAFVVRSTMSIVPDPHPLPNQVLPSFIVTENPPRIVAVHSRASFEFEDQGSSTVLQVTEIDFLPMPRKMVSLSETTYMNSIDYGPTQAHQRKPTEVDRAIQTMEDTGIQASLDSLDLEASDSETMMEESETPTLTLPAPPHNAVAVLPKLAISTSFIQGCEAEVGGSVDLRVQPLDISKASSSPIDMLAPSPSTAHEEPRRRPLHQPIGLQCYHPSPMSSGSSDAYLTASLGPLPSAIKSPDKKDEGGGSGVRFTNSAPQAIEYTEVAHEFHDPDSDTSDYEHDASLHSLAELGALTALTRSMECKGIKLSCPFGRKSMKEVIREPTKLEKVVVGQGLPVPVKAKPEEKRVEKLSALPVKPAAEAQRALCNVSEYAVEVASGGGGGGDEMETLRMDLGGLCGEIGIALSTTRGDKVCWVGKEEGPLPPILQLALIVPEPPLTIGVLDLYGTDVSAQSVTQITIPSPKVLHVDRTRLAHPVASVPSAYAAPELNAMKPCTPQPPCDS